MDNLVLVGFSCSGKTTIGRILARRLGLRFADTDRLVEQRAERSIPDIFRTEGEAAFRALEQEAVVRVCAERFQVISTGGGAFMDPRNRELLRQGNLVIHLRVRPGTVVQRLRSSKRGRPRPLLNAPDPLRRVTELMTARRHAYGLAHVGIDVDERSAHSIASEIARHWFGWRRARGVAQAPPAGERRRVVP
jgi:shikimate kinase